MNNTIHVKPQFMYRSISLHELEMYLNRVVHDLELYMNRSGLYMEPYMNRTVHELVLYMNRLVHKLELYMEEMKSYINHTAYFCFFLLLFLVSLTLFSLSPLPYLWYLPPPHPHFFRASGGCS